MSATTVLILFLCLRVAQYVFERQLAKWNRDYYRNPDNQKEAQRILEISDEAMGKTLVYSEDKYQFAKVAGAIQLTMVLLFLSFGGLGLAEDSAVQLVDGSILQGLVFFLILGILSLLMGIPFSYYRTFVLEEKHGFNRQTKSKFWRDIALQFVLSIVLGGAILAILLWIMQAAGPIWWVYAWIAVSSFSIVTAWAYPTFLAPLFNKFKPVEEGELLTQINDLAKKIGFRTDGIYIMDASTRSSHGNAYFTGVFGKKRIVLFDTLVDAMSPSQVVAVLAHELGHFKLRHVRWQLIRGICFTGLLFYLLSLCLPLQIFYDSFGLNGVSNYGALVVFGLWFGIVDFVLQPLENSISRRNEFSADAFARSNVAARDLAAALLRLRETSNVMPISHPLFSSVYHSHPPLLERLKALG